MNNLRITTVQTPLHWESPVANLEMLEVQLRTLEATDVIILPEMFTTGFTMNTSAVAESMTGPTIKWLSDQAAKHEAVVTGSFVVKEEQQFYNRLVWMRPDGSYDVYDKHHLFTLAKEDLAYTAGQKKLITIWKGWKICPLICYDLRFPGWSRNMEDYDLLLYVANWPRPRATHWKSLLVARAIENQCYVAGVNRVGKDEKGLDYSGDTSVIDYSGNVYYQLTDEAGLYTVELSYDEQQTFRQKLNFLKDRDDVRVV